MAVEGHTNVFIPGIYVVVHLYKSGVRTNGLVRLYAIEILRHL